MRGAVLATHLFVTALLPAGLAAQTAGQPEQPPFAVPAAPAGSSSVSAPAPPGQSQEASGQGGTANVCRELIAFVHPAPPADVSSGAQAQPQAQAPSQAAAGAPEPQQSLHTAVTAPPQSKAAADAARASGQGPPTQSGISGTTPRSTPYGTPGPQAEGQRPFVTQPQPAPPNATTTPKPTPTMVAQAQAAAAGNDIAACRSVAQDMRRAGVAMPPALIALAGLELEYHPPAQPR
jgi:hypothetical protein